MTNQSRLLHYAAQFLPWQESVLFLVKGEIKKKKQERNQKFSLRNPKGLNELNMNIRNIFGVPISLIYAHNLAPWYCFDNHSMIY